MVSVFDRKYKDVLDNPVCQTSSHTDRMSYFCRQQKFIFTFEDLDIAKSKIFEGRVEDSVHSNHVKLAGPVFRNLL